MSIVYVVCLLVILAALAVFAGVGWLPVSIALGLFLLGIIAIYRVVMPILHVVVLLVCVAGLAIFAGVGWLHVAVTLALSLLIIIAIHRLKP